MAFALMFEIALSMETVKKDTQQLRGHDSHSGIAHTVEAEKRENML